MVLMSDGRRALWPLLVVMLLTSLLAAPLPAAAQTGSVAESLLPDAVNETEVLQDPEGDAETGVVLVGVPVPPTDADAPVDILAVRIAETASHLRVSLQNRGYPADLAEAFGAVPYSYQCYVQFFTNEGVRGYRAQWFHTAGAAGGPWTVEGNLRAYDESAWDGAELDAALVADDHFEIIVPKDYLTVGEEGRALRKGDTLQDFFGRCAHGAGVVRITDYAFGGGAAFRVNLTAGTSEIGISFPSAGPQGLSVVAGMPNRLTVNLHNFAERKLLVNFSAELVDGSGAPLEGWTLFHAHDLEVKRGAAVGASVVVAPPAGTPHGSGGILKVRALPLGAEGPATAERPLRVVQPLTAENNTLYFHNGGDPYYQSCLPSCSGPLPPAAAETVHSFLMNGLKTDPALGETAPGPVGAVVEFTAATVALDAPLPLPIELDDNGTMELGVALRTAQARSVELYAALTLDGMYGEYVGSAYGYITVHEAFETHVVKLQRAIDRIEAGRTIHLTIYIEEEAVPIPLLGGIPLAPMEWDPSGSHLALPVRPSDGPAQHLTDGRFLPTLQTMNGTDTEEYVNPGGSVAFDLLLLNEGTEEDVLRIQTDVSEPGWSVTAHPGDQFKLLAGKSAPLCLELRAPAGAAKNTAVAVNVTATSRGDTAVSTSLPLRLLVTGGIELDDTTCTERVDAASEDYVPPFVDERDSPLPGLELLAWVGAAAGAALVRRRRSVAQSV